MKVTTPLNETMIVQLDAGEALLVLKALTHTQHKLFSHSDRNVINTLAQEVESRLSCVVQIRKHEHEQGLTRVGLV